MQSTEQKIERAALAGLAAACMEERERSTEVSLAELAALVETAGGQPVATLLQSKPTPDPRTFLGEGKVAELRELILANDCDLAVFDNELSPSQMRVLEEELGVRVLDRSGLILDIFAQRAQTREGQLQVELAQYQYLLPRLTGMWTHLVRQTASGGSSPIGTYEQLVKWYEKGDLDFADVTTVNLDEYYGMKPENDQSYHYFMHDHFFDHVNIDPSRINLPNGMEPDEKKECARYDAVLRSVGDVDIQLLGIGRNGHIGFNEPDDCFAKGTHCVELTESTIEANKRFFASEDEVPRRAYSMGIHTIMTAKKVLVVASGEDKAWAIRESCFGPVTPKVPGSILQLHNDAIVIADEAALSLCGDFL